MVPWLITNVPEVKEAWDKNQKWLQRRDITDNHYWWWFARYHQEDAESLHFWYEHCGRHPDSQREWWTEWRTHIGRGEGEPETQAAQDKDGCSLFDDPDDAGEEEVE